MINQMSISGYKCLRQVSLDLAHLNLFVGPNAAGKSSALQMLLLLRQSANEAGQVVQLKLNGELYEGGMVRDVLHPEAAHAIGCQLDTSNGKFSYSFTQNREVENYLLARNMTPTDSIAGVPLPQELSGQSYIYLNAERRSPAVRYPLLPENPPLAGELGKWGELTTATLAAAKSANRIVEGWGTEQSGFGVNLGRCAHLLDEIELTENLMHSSGRLDTVANHLLGWIMPGAQFQAGEVPETDNAVLSFIRDTEKTRSTVRPTHIGFGLTYALPVIVAGLALKQGGILIVENPEAHLHPFSQSRIGVFLALAAAAGRQIFVETHSDHVINGMRLALAKGFICPEQLKTHYFKRPQQGTTANILTIGCDRNGRMESWPSGFFDQIESDLAQL